VGFDMEPTNSCKAFADIVVKVPPSDSPEYPEYLADICQKLGVDVLLPIIDTDFVVLDPHRDLFGDALFMPEYCKNLTDKKKCTGIIAAAGCRPPNIHKKFTGEKLIWKPRYGAGARGVRVVDHEQELPEGGLLFTYIDGPEYTIDFIAVEGELIFCAQRLRMATRSGVSTVCQVMQIEEDALADLDKLVTHIGYHGIGCFQFMRDHSGQIYWTDLNPRPGGGTSMTVAAGLNLPAMFFAQFVNCEPPEPELIECTVARYFEDHLL